MSTVVENWRHTLNNAFLQECCLFIVSLIKFSNLSLKAIHIQVPVGIPTPDGGLEIPNRVFLGGIPTEVFSVVKYVSKYRRLV